MFYSGVLIVDVRDGEERTMAFSNSAICAYMNDHSLSSAVDGQTLEEMIIETPELEVSINSDGIVVSFVAVESQAVAGTCGQGNVLGPASASTSTASETDFLD